MTIKKGDTVKVIAGRDNGKTGVVERVFPVTGRVVVAGINLRKHHLKPRANRPKGGIVEAPAPLSRSNVMPVCPHCGKPTRVRHTAGEKGSFRSCAHCNGSLDK